MESATNTTEFIKWVSKQDEDDKVESLSIVACPLALFGRSRHPSAYSVTGLGMFTGYRVQEHEDQTISVEYRFDDGSEFLKEIVTSDTFGELAAKLKKEKN